MTTTDRPIKTVAEYETAVARIDALMGASVGTPEETELDALATLVEAYEEQAFPIEAPDAEESLTFRSEHEGRTVPEDTTTGTPAC